LLALCVSCSGEAPEPTALAVALLLAGPENDQGWNQAAYDGLRRIREELGARTRKVTVRGAAEIEKALRTAAQQGFHLVIGHGVEFNAPALEVASDHPGVAFVTTGGPTSSANLATLVLRVEEAAYCLGILAGRMTRSSTASAISGEEFEPVRRVVGGFRAGLLTARPGARVLEQYLGSWEDSALAKETALTHADAGADVFFQNADAAGVGVFEACRARGTFAFGCNRDQSAKAPDVILASAVADIAETLLEIAREVEEQRFSGGTRSFGMREGKVRVVFNEALEEKIPAGVVQEVRAAEQRISSGELVPGIP
jgi:basic membrane lipoprotein Med (substrate-binding protein (PBP1-ABC) superfamily)